MSNKSTIISIAPCAFNEDKTSLIPRYYFIPKCDNPSRPVLVHVGDAETFEYIDEVRKNRRYPIESHKVAASLVNDIRNSIFGKDAETNAFPGLTYVPEYFTTQSELEKKYPNLLKSLQEQQTNWYKFLVHIADDDWQKWHQHKMITSLSVAAAKALGLEREWIIDFDDTASKCPACFSFIPGGASICRHCHTIVNPEKYAMFQKATKA